MIKIIFVIVFPWVYQVILRILILSNICKTIGCADENIKNSFMLITLLITPWERANMHEIKINTKQKTENKIHQWKLGNRVQFVNPHTRNAQKGCFQIPCCLIDKLDLKLCRKISIKLLYLLKHFSKILKYYFLFRQVYRTKYFYNT